MIDTAADSHGRSGPDACSVVWDNAQGSALGTAPAAMFWVALEQEGPWGARAATQSRLDPDVGTALERMCQEAGGRLILIRRPGTHPNAPEGRRQRVYLAGGLAARPWLLEADLDDPARLLGLARLQLAARQQSATMGSGEVEASADIDAVRQVLPELEPSPHPVLMVCTNSRRDVCCAVRGRPVALESSAQRPGQVWECSHTGGHRFAPTGVLLPYGQTFGRLSPGSAVKAIDAAALGDVPQELLGAAYDRGRSHLSAPAQAAESIVRQQIHETRLLALSTTATPAPSQENAESTESTWRCRVSHLDGRHWDVVARRGAREVDLPESCGKAAVPTWTWDCRLD